MILAVDIGGTKTLLGSFSQSGEVTQKIKFETSKNYTDFLRNFEINYKQLVYQDFIRAVVAVPGRLDREHGRALGYGTMGWPTVSIEADLEAIVGCPVIIENDTKLAGLSEAILIIKEFKRVLYITISTGISDALIVNGVIDPAMQDSEGGQMWLEHKGKRVQWEDFASGSAIVKSYGKKASDIHDEQTWQKISADIAVGLINLIVTIQPEVIVMGGGVNTNFSVFVKILEKILKQYETPLTPIPPLRKAGRPEEAVIYGCYELAKQKLKAPINNQLVEA